MEGDGFHADEGFGVQQLGANERHGRCNAAEHVQLEFIQEVARRNLDRWVHPNCCVHDVTHLASKMSQPATEMLTDELELFGERFREDRFAFA